MCRGYGAREFFQHYYQGRITCPYCERYSDCDKVSYQYSHSLTRLADSDDWCSKSSESECLTRMFGAFSIIIG